MMRRTLIGSIAFVLTACHSSGNIAVPGDSNDHDAFAGIAAHDTIRFTGTEPFWGGEIAGNRLTYSTPDNPRGTVIPVKRFAGRGGLSLSGELDGGTFDLMITEGNCSDGMSDRSYPFVVTLKLGEETRQGCAWTDQKLFTGGRSP
jgi:uncharacterized membrane protein